jgi:hypothetical protein
MTLTFPVSARKLEALTEDAARNNAANVEQFIIDTVVQPHISAVLESKEAARKAKLLDAFSALTVAEQTAVMKLAKAE